MSNQIILKNSKRRHEKRTYTPLIIADSDPFTGSDALGMAAMVRSLQMSDDEVKQLKDRLQSPDQVNALQAMSNLSKAVSATGVLAASSGLISVSRDDLRSVADILGNIRSDAANQMTNTLRSLEKSWSSASVQIQKPAITG